MNKVKGYSRIQWDQFACPLAYSCTGAAVPVPVTLAIGLSGD